MIAICLYDVDSLKIVVQECSLKAVNISSVDEHVFFVIHLSYFKVLRKERTFLCALSKSLQYATIL